MNPNLIPLIAKLLEIPPSAAAAASNPVSTLPRARASLELEKRRIEVNIDVISGELVNG